MILRCREWSPPIRFDFDRKREAGRGGRAGERATTLCRAEPEATDLTGAYVNDPGMD